MNRRLFFNSLLTGVGAASILKERAYANKKKNNSMVKTPISVCTWDFKEANFRAGMELESGKDALSSAIIGATVEEDNPKNSTVGYGGAPDREGTVTLDAAVMDYKGNCGSVLGVEKVVNVSSLARDVMEKTPHVILSGKGAQNFALQNGYKLKSLLTDESKKNWKEWKKKPVYNPKTNVDNHDTIGILCLDKKGNIGGVCSTSGLAYKMEGRIGDSPIIGSGLYIDNNVGGAVATGLGEEIIKIVGSFLVVELMRNGKTPKQACDEAILRIYRKNKSPKFQVAFLALDKHGNSGSSCLQEGFSYYQFKNNINKNLKVKPI
jgi:N4-(beta-N-acetylglucosaminyl)-L-asparaginase